MFKRTMSLVVLFLIIFSAAFAQKKKKKEEKKKEKFIAEFVKDFKKSTGLFNLYRDQKEGELYLEIDVNSLDKEFIHFTYTENGIAGVSHFRGNYRGSKIFKIQKHFNKIEFIHENTSYYFDPKSAISRAKEANISNSVLTSHKIVATNEEKTKFLINADELFLKEDFDAVKPNYSPKFKGYKLGTLSKTKTKYSKIRNSPENTDIIVDYVYENKKPTGNPGAGTTDSRYITIKAQHSFIAVPKNNYKPRRDDERIGYFMSQVTDLTSFSTTPWRDIINRWHLEKKDPSVALSEPKEPITWWIENTTPVELRETIKEAVLSWNIAFEQAGFKNAVVVKIQPDDAEWDAGDIRYNVLRWTSSPNPPFGGYGPSFTNPRTGQILGSDIMLEYIYLLNRDWMDKIFNSGFMALTDDPTKFCLAAKHLQQSVSFGKIVVDGSPLAPFKNSKLQKQALKYLLLHEVGHTLGLNHNMKASSMLTVEELKNPKIVAEKGITGSVMDYPAINVALDKKDQTDYFVHMPGPYDKWAIEFGYSHGMDAEDAEYARLEKILSRSAENDLMFGNDADDMRSPGNGVDPRVNISDMSSEPVKFSEERIALVIKIAKTALKDFSEDGKSYEDLRRIYYSLLGAYSTSLRTATAQIGGVYVNRAVQGQLGAKQPLKPVDEKTQKAAVNLISKYGFSENAYALLHDFLPILQMQRRGFNHWGNNEDPKTHSYVLNRQRQLLSYMLHQNVFRRLTDTQLYGNTYTVSKYMKDMDVAIFESDIDKNVNSFRRNLQVEYITQLLSIYKSKEYDYNTKSIVFNSISSLESDLEDNIDGNLETKSHRKYLIRLIKSAMDK